MCRNPQIMCVCGSQGIKVLLRLSKSHQSGGTNCSIHNISSSWLGVNQNNWVKMYLKWVSKHTGTFYIVVGNLGENPNVAYSMGFVSVYFSANHCEMCWKDTLFRNSISTTAEITTTHCHKALWLYFYFLLFLGY